MGEIPRGRSDVTKMPERRAERGWAGSCADRQAALAQVIRFLPMERKEVSVGPGSTGHEPGRAAVVF